MSSTNPSPQESSSDNDLNDLLALLGSESESPSSTIPSIEDSLVQQLDSFEEVNEQQKTTLPPCQVCGGPSSGFHYGCYTCEACKVFFRRSLKNSIGYECLTKRKNCSPAADFRFHCRACRFNKCLDVGMSRQAIRTGRYTKGIHKSNQNTLSKMENDKKSVPYLINHTDSQDLIIQCMNIFYDAMKIDWRREIEDFDAKFENASAVCRDGIFPKNDYMDILKLSGLEIDYRKSFMSIFNSVMEISSIRFMKAVKNIPGFKELSGENFMDILLSHRDDIHIFNSTTNNLIWTDEGLICSLGKDYNLTLKKDDFKNLTDANFAITEETVLRTVQSLKLTVEESIFLLVISLLNPNNKSDHLRSYYNRYLIAFTRYLESTYGNSYHERLLSIVNFVSLFKRTRLFIEKWMRKNEDYVNQIDQNGCLTKMWSNSEEMSLDCKKLSSMFEQVTV